MPQTKKQEVVFTILMVIVMAYGMSCYNIAIGMGDMSNDVFVKALTAFPIMGIIAFVFEFFLVSKLSKKLAFRLVNPEQDKPIFVILAISSMTVCLMCPIMTFWASILTNFNGIENMLANWLELIVRNFAMALCFQIFFAGPFIRFIFKRIFKNKLAN